MSSIKECLFRAHSDVFSDDEAASAPIPFADTHFREQIDVNGHQLVFIQLIS